MTREDFLENAKALFEKKKQPHDRLSTKTQSIIESHNPIFDIHCHFFDKNCLDVRYVLLRMLKEKVFGTLGLESLYHDKFQEANNQYEISEEVIYQSLENNNFNEVLVLQNLENGFGSETQTEFLGHKTDTLLNIIKFKSHSEILEYYLNNWALNKNYNVKDRPIINGLLMMDLEMGWKKSPNKSLKSQIDEVKQLSANEPILPFLALHPDRVDENLSKDKHLYDLFLHAFSGENHFFGVKCYPSLGYYPYDFRLEPIFQICNEYNIPVVTHCGGESVSTYKKVMNYHDGHSLKSVQIPGDTRIERAKHLNDPDNWLPVLKKFRNLKLNLAHFGGDTNWESYNGKFNSQSNCTIDKIIKLLEYKSFKVYTDFSYNLINTTIIDVLKQSIEKHPIIKEKLLFGSDFWVVLPAGNLNTSQDYFLKVFENEICNYVVNNPKSFLFG